MSDYLQNLFIDEVKGLLNGGSAGNLEEKIAELVGSAPENLDTLEELAKVLNNVAETINASNEIVGNINELSTKDKTNLVSAINECNERINSNTVHFEYDSETGNLYYVTEE